jgi:hypothetical protein
MVRWYVDSVLSSHSWLFRVTLMSMIQYASALTEHFKRFRIIKYVLWVCGAPSGCGWRRWPSDMEDIVYHTLSKHPWFQASAAMLMKSVVIWVITRRRVVIIYLNYHTTPCNYPEDHRFHWISSCGQPTRDSPPNGELVVSLITRRLKNNHVI